ncbi:MAG: hypothetical protein KCHDKBKB_01130 [Elusimicrobia bacterium]|nr:hypothetical protein [Elusimicrobiota bacterium]
MDTKKKRAVFVCGNKYGFRSAYLPLIEQVSEYFTSFLILLDYPEGYEISNTLKTLEDKGILSGFSLVPDSKYIVRHHLAMGRLLRSLSQGKMDLLIVDVDFMPMHRYLIGLARRQNAPVMAVQKETPTQLLVEYQKTNTTKTVAPFSFNKNKLPLYLRFRNRGRAVVRRTLNHYFFPGLLTGHFFPMHAYEKSGKVLFATDRVDKIVVYEPRTYEALQVLFPHVPVVLAHHPRMGHCRCGEVKEKKGLLVILGGPWSYYVSETNSERDILNRWVDFISQVVTYHPNLAIHIRPHPRETKPYVEQIVQELRKRKLQAFVLEAQRNSVLDIVCDFNGVIGAPSGALSEATIGCDKAFVIGVKGVERINDSEPEVGEYSDAIQKVQWGEPLSEELFVRQATTNSSLPLISEILLAV